MCRNRKPVFNIIKECKYENSHDKENIICDKCNISTPIRYFNNYKYIWCYNCNYYKLM
jgi:hypothetical protein